MKISLNFPDNLLKKLDEYCEKHDYERSELVRGLVRQLLEISLPPVKVENEDSIPTSTTPPENTYVKGTIPVENTPIGTSPSKIEPEALWEDYNLMPVYKTGVPDQYCVTWHAKGERRMVYPIKKFRADGSVELEGNYCKECIKEFLAKDGHLE